MTNKDRDLELPSLIPPKKSRQEIIAPKFDKLSVMIFGIPGAGKTRFFDGDENVIFASTNPNQEFLQSRIVPIKTWGTFQQLTHQIYKEKQAGNDICSGVVIDIVDDLQVMCQDYVCAKAGVKHPNDRKDFGKTWSAVTKEWKQWLDALMGLTSVRFLTHCEKEKVEVVNEHGLKEEVMRFFPTFSSTKAAQHLDVVLNAVGYISQSRDGRHCLTFKQQSTVAAKDRTDILSSFGDIFLPTNPRESFNYVSRIYQEQAQKMGIRLI